MSPDQLFDWTVVVCECVFVAALAAFCVGCFAYMAWELWRDG